MPSLINLIITRDNPSDHQSPLIATHGSVQLTVTPENHDAFTKESMDYSPWLLEKDGEVIVGMSPKDWIAWLASSVIS